MKTIVEVSKVADGSMGKESENVLTNRSRFLATHSISPEQTVLVHLVYEGDDYCRYDEVDATDGGDGIVRPSTKTNDGLFTRRPGIALFLPLADCVGAVLVDTKQRILGLSHMGRHNLEQFGARRSVEYMQSQFGSEPADIIVYMSPAAGRENYPLFSFDNRSMHDVTREQLLEARVLPENIQAAVEDTTKDSEYFSHSEFLKGHRHTDGRHALVAQLVANKLKYLLR